MKPIPKPEKRAKKEKKWIKSRRVKSKKRLSESKNKIIELEDIWADLIKRLAGMQSELSGVCQNLQSHHINGKSTHLLRFSLVSGICLTGGEHIWGIHNPDRMEDYRAKIIECRLKRFDESIYSILNRLKHHGPKVSLVDAENYLTEMKRRIDAGEKVELTVTPNKTYNKEN